MTKTDLAGMTLEEKLRLLGLLWDDLAAGEDADKVVPDWHEAVVNERLTALATGAVTVEPLDDAMRALRAELGIA